MCCQIIMAMIMSLGIFKDTINVTFPNYAYYNMMEEG